MYGTTVIYKPEQIDPLINSKLGSAPDSFIITSPEKIVKSDKITSDFLKEYCGNSHSEYYDDFCIACGRGAAWNINLGIQNGKSKYKTEGREAVFQRLLKNATDDRWISAHNFNDAMTYLKTHYATIFNKDDPYQGTLGCYSKMYYMKDVT